ncbi:MAG TPA: hypothetical protein VG734_25250 [Lacunisphaera sp.]|nr:hypothetical protein [Lacunisphaera sp.]
MNASTFFKASTLSLLIAAGALAAGTEGTTPVAPTPEIDHMVYLRFLPAPADLMADARRDGLTVVRLEQLPGKVVVTYRYPDGHTATLGYAHIDSAPSSDRAAAYESREEPVIERSTTTIVREPEIVYVDRYPSTRVVYRDYYPDDYWFPLTFGLSLGYYSGYHSYYPRYWNSHSSGYRGSYRGDYRGSSHGGYNGNYRGGTSHIGGGSHHGGSDHGGRRH